jgi:hypothetical protein
MAVFEKNLTLFISKYHGSFQWESSCVSECEAEGHVDYGVLLALNQFLFVNRSVTV